MNDKKAERLRDVRFFKPLLKWLQRLLEYTYKVLHMSLAVL